MYANGAGRQQGPTARLDGFCLCEGCDDDDRAIDDGLDVPLHLGQSQQNGQREDCRDDGQRIQTLADGDPQGGDEPNATRRGEAPDEVADADNGPRPQEPDAGDNSRCNTPGIDLDPRRGREHLGEFPHAGGGDHDDGRPQTDENVGAQPGWPSTGLPFQANGATEPRFVV